MARHFQYDGHEIPDPDPALSPDEVRRELAVHLPALANSEIREEKQSEDVLYTFVKKIGTKGSNGDVVELIRRVPERRLSVFELAWELVDEEGNLDIERAADRLGDIETAIQQADAEADTTRRARTALGSLEAR